MIRLTISTLVMCLIGLTVSAQSAKDYFLPEKSKKQASFLVPKKTTQTRTLQYQVKGKNAVVTNTKLTDGVAKSIEASSYQITDKTILLTKIVFTGSIEKNEAKDYSTSETFFQMPAKADTAKWFYHNFFGDQVDCKSYWTTLKVKDKETEVIRVNRAVEDGIGYHIEYYVKGIGLWQIHFARYGGGSSISYELNELK